MHDSAEIPTEMSGSIHFPGTGQRSAGCLILPSMTDLTEVFVPQPSIAS
jgi:hypothetical protein